MRRHNLYAALLLAAVGYGCAKGPSASKPTTDVAKLSEAAPKYAETITAADLSKHLHIIASDEYEGRNTGEKGQKMAAEYIAREFREDGLTGPVTANSANPYYQTFDLQKSTWGEGHISIGKEKYLMMQDFFPFGGSPFTTEQAVEAVYMADAGQVTEQAAKGKLVATMLTAAEMQTKMRGFSAAAEKASAKGVVYVLGAEEYRAMAERFSHRIKQPSISQANNGSSRPATIFATPTVGAAILGTTPEKMQQNTATASFKPASDIKILMSRTSEPLATENVLGFVEGTDKKEEIVVVTAHYDHVGVDESLEGDKIYNGANDDGSGTVAVIELAEAFAQAKKAGYGPRRSVLFMTVTGEEKGLLGSEYYSQNPIFPLENTVANVNIDMIGRMDYDHEKTNDSNYIYVIGADKLSSELHQINEDMNQKYVNLKLDYTYNDENDPNRFYYRSDHYNFAKNGIPIVFYFNGVHDDYHQPGDEPDKIIYESAEKVARLAFHVAWELANRENRIVVDSNKK
ncbi:M28 family peptidase [Pontibacter anaerobius]|uniref:M28 family peptidase n=1 Tax=Pontibacter anaerobius TaxID=2993940 RepID=A0ABT3RJQ4_9BACT|nr:M28 family peptidase [Pontibacter anaerobius]MCX2742040.1 M28 family peptidase [Pontibacter anaerobius]